MQVADIFIQGINLAHSGLDQRKAHVIAREVALQLKVKPLLDKKKKAIKPIAVHHHLILGLQKPTIWPVPKEQMQDLWGSMKMSKSIPDSAIFITDSPEEIKRKLAKAFCPEKESYFNPVLDWAKYLIFRSDKDKLRVDRPEKFGGNMVYKSYSHLEKDFVGGKLHPMDLKNAVTLALIEILEPVRKHFEQPKIKKMKEDMEKLIITR